MILPSPLKKVSEPSQPSLKENPLTIVTSLPLSGKLVTIKAQAYVWCPTCESRESPQRAGNGLEFSESLLRLGSVSSRECPDAPTILATFTAGRTGLVACPWRHYNFNNYADNPHVICLDFMFFF